jgi:tRNA threonylcarbamoyladenosine biosynthesis protein TsaB
VLILALDTTTPFGSVALLDRSRLLAETNVESAGSHSSRLMRSIGELLRLSGKAIEEVDGFAVASGPGSFTGIRIGLSTVKALAMASAKPVAPVSTLLALAVKLEASPARLICPLIDAKKGEVFAALVETRRNEFREIIPQGAYSPDDFFSRLPAHRIVSFIGTGADVFKDKILAYLKDKARFSSRSLFIAREVGMLGYDALKRGRGVSGEVLEPLYLRKSQAEEKK